MPWKEIRDANGKVIGTAIVCTRGRKPRLQRLRTAEHDSL
jgi:hypothetical protein